MSLVKKSAEVFYYDDSVVKIGTDEIDFLKNYALSQPRLRSRVCTHPDVNSSLHEMLIVHTKDTYVRPHKHLGKSESFHVIEGCFDIVLFDEGGNINNLVEMGPFNSGKTFYYRLNEAEYHTLIIHSEIVVFHEVTNGPFDPNKTVFPDWAPLDYSSEFKDKLSENLKEYQNESSIYSHFGDGKIT